MSVYNFFNQQIFKKTLNINSIKKIEIENYEINNIKVKCSVITDLAYRYYSQKPVNNKTNKTKHNRTKKERDHKKYLLKKNN